MNSSQTSFELFWCFVSLLFFFFLRSSFVLFFFSSSSFPSNTHTVRLSRRRAKHSFSTSCSICSSLLLNNPSMSHTLADKCDTALRILRDRYGLTDLQLHVGCVVCWLSVRCIVYYEIAYKSMTVGSQLKVLLLNETLMTLYSWMKMNWCAYANHFGWHCSFDGTTIGWFT